MTWIVIPNRDGLQFLPDCLRTLREYSPEAAVCVVDNASSDASVDFVRKAYPNVHAIELEMNLGFVQATNLGLLAGLRAGAQTFVLLNNDTRVSSGWLQAIESAAAIEPDLGIVGAWQNDFDGNPSPRTKAILAAVGLECEAANGALPSASLRVAVNLDHSQLATRNSQLLRLSSLLPSLVDADWVEGSCLWMRREVLEQIGFLDPLFAPAYFEEVDFCRRARRAGWRIAMATHSAIEHLGAGSSQSVPARSRRRILSERNYLIYHGADPDRNSAASMTTLLGKAIRRGLKAWRRREISLLEWATAVAELPARIPGIAAKNRRDRRNRPCPILGDQSLSTLEQRYYADCVARLERTPTPSV